MLRVWTAPLDSVMVQQFHGFFEERVGPVIDLKVMIPRWPEKRPDVLMCIRVDTIPVPEWR